MAMHGAHAGGHPAHDEHIDHQGNANLAVWLGLIALTFTTAAFVAANVYLRGWNPSKFDRVTAGLLKELPYWDTLFLIIAGVLLLIAAPLFVKNRWKAFNGVLALATIAFMVVLVIQFRLMIWFTWASPQVATLYAPTAVIEFLLTLLSVILLAVAGWYANFGSKKKINGFFPIAMNVWLYTIISAIVILLVEDVMSIGEFAAWCGQHLT
ncbi:MAG: hypothetical protein IRZ33_01995 [Alicyclobacillaceae bacterium]|nr:hypothetical protein [Alicyclobacillaceae bacterium]